MAGARAHERGRLGRFLLSGAFNTALTYGLYLLLLPWWGHRLAYSAVFAGGIVLAYVLNRMVVFRSHAGWRSAAAMPVIYALQYLVSLAVVEAWVRLGLPAWAAPLPAIALSLPLNYLLSRWSFTERRDPNAPPQA